MLGGRFDWTALRSLLTSTIPRFHPRLCDCLTPWLCSVVPHSPLRGGPGAAVTGREGRQGRAAGPARHPLPGPHWRPLAPPGPAKSHRRGRGRSCRGCGEAGGCSGVCGMVTAGERSGAGGGSAGLRAGQGGLAVLPAGAGGAEAGRDPRRGRSRPRSPALGRGRPFSLFVSAAACGGSGPGRAGRPAGPAWAPGVTRDSPGPGARPVSPRLAALLQSQGDASRILGGCSGWAPGSSRLERLVSACPV